MSLTEALRAGAPQAFDALYDEYAEPLYAYCYVMVGVEASDALSDAFSAVARRPDAVPGDDAELPVWLYSLARTECVRRGALTRAVATTTSTDPLRRALALLSPEHREILALTNALDPEQTSRVLGVTRDTAETLAWEAQLRLEEAAASVSNRQPRDSAMLSPLSGEALHRLVTLGYEPPAGQRERILSSCATVAAWDEDATVHIGEPPPIGDPHAEQNTSSVGRRLLPVVAAVACVAAVAGAAFALSGSGRTHDTGTAVRPSAPSSRSAQPTRSGGQTSPSSKTATSDASASPTPTRGAARGATATPRRGAAGGSSSATRTPPAKPTRSPKATPTTEPSSPSEPPLTTEPTPSAEPTPSSAPSPTAEAPQSTEPTSPAEHTPVAGSGSPTKRPGRHPGRRPGRRPHRPKPHHTAAPSDAPADGHRSTGRRGPGRACHEPSERPSRCGRPRPWRPEGGDSSGARRQPRHDDPQWVPGPERPQHDDPEWAPGPERPRHDDPEWVPGAGQPRNDDPEWVPGGERPRHDDPQWMPGHESN
ncbi:hypothetical protein GCM10023196_058060 [Actinoallomurus vinaceus]|uniref:DNA-directed RNA polymerase specialized sigma24 family protein n=1 Tax=Actinoallomurus vinaceus TaxID=1080074 RepID=A0ABP8UFN5_9ACTN